MNEQPTIYLIIQKGYEIFGSGDSPEKALEDAKEWMDRDSVLILEELPSYNTANDGAFCLVTKDEYDQGNC